MSPVIPGVCGKLFRMYYIGEFCTVGFSDSSIYHQTASGIANRWRAGRLLRDKSISQSKSLSRRGRCRADAGLPFIVACLLGKTFRRHCCRLALSKVYTYAHATCFACNTAVRPTQTSDAHVFLTRVRCSRTGGERRILVSFLHTHDRTVFTRNVCGLYGASHLLSPRPTLDIYLA